MTDELLAAIWAAVHDLHTAGISHRNLDPQRILVGDRGTIAIDDLTAAAATEDRYWFNRDNAAVVVETANIVGNDRAVAAAHQALGTDRLAELIPLVQPAALPKAVSHGVKHLAKALKELRTALATAAGVDDVQTLKIQRFGWADIGITIGVLIALFFAIRSLLGHQLVFGGG